VVRLRDVDDHRFDARPSDGVGICVASDTGEHVKSPPGQIACRGRADPGGRASDDDDLS